jgi:hypothetical protein
VLTTCDYQGQNNDIAWKRLKELTNKELGNEQKLNVFTT